MFTRRPSLNNNTTINNVSYNGGPGGTQAKPTNEELAIAKEKHIPPTQAQVTHVRAASKTETAFASVNNGKPAVAATAHAGRI